MASEAQDDKSLAAEAMLHEYDVLRAEIALYHQQQNQSLNFAMIGIFAAASAFYALLGSGLADADLFQRVLLLGLPLFVMINGIAFSDRSFRVKRIARYLHYDLRPELMDLLNGREVWRWEIFKSSSHRAARGRGRLLSLAIDHFRMALFWLASVASWLLYCQEVQWRAFGCTLLEKILIFLNVVFFVVFLLASWGIEETTGATGGKNQNEGGEGG